MAIFYRGKCMSITNFLEIAWRSTLGISFIITLFRPSSVLTTYSHKNMVVISKKTEYTKRVDASQMRGNKLNILHLC
jgi:hypothetical protein